MSDEIRRPNSELWDEFAGSGDAPARLKSRVFSRVNLEQAKQGPLASVSESKAAGRALCVFENIMEIAPTGDAIKRMNYCRVCHARVLAENMDQAPIWWPGCPYAEFQK